MIISIALFLLFVSVLAGAAAATAEEGLGRAGVPTRWLWLGALAAGPALLVLPIVAPISTSAAAVRAVTAAPVVELAPMLIDASGRDLALAADALIAALWLFTVGATVLFLLRSHAGLGRARRAWQTTSIRGRTVLLSEGVGPAVTGLRSPGIVLPRWALELAGTELEFVLLHEEEHVRGRDTVLLAAALGIVTLAPWNPACWWMLRRLRAAVEIDCDRRVLRRAPDRPAYGSSLLAVAARESGLTLGLAAFAEGRNALERRIRAMTTRKTRWTALRALGFVSLAMLVALQACGIDSPVTLDDSDPVAAVAPSLPEVTIPAPAEPAADIRAEPTFTPFTVAPAIVNRDEVIAMMTRSYPPLLKEAGVGGTTRVFFFINTDGVVEQVRLDQSSGHAALDDAALSVAGAYRFSPARNGDDAVPVWVSFPITFQVR